jgi:hypothetical protein
MNLEKGSPADPTKREFVKKATYVVPAVVTLAAAPSFASAGSNSKGAKKGKGHHHKYPKNARGNGGYRRAWKKGRDD